MTRPPVVMAPRPGRAHRLLLLVYACLGAATIGPRPAYADRADEAWKQANDAYLRGDYSAAIAGYEQLDRPQVVSPDLTFNLGDAYFRSGRMGPAIWAWERTLTLDPDDDDARFNLDQARKVAARRVQDKMEGADHEPGWIRLVNQLSPATETWLFVGLYLAFFAALGLLLRARRRADSGGRATEDDGDGDGESGGASGGASGERESHASARATWGVVTGLLAVATACSGALLAGRLILDRTPFAIVMPDAAPVKDGADANYRTSFDVHAGLRVRVVDQDHDWVRVRLANGLEGWLPARSIGRL